MANATIDKGAMHKLSYGLFALFTNDGAKDNACIINTATQISDDPKTISICVNRANYSNETIKKSGVFTISILSESAPFDIFKRFGFASGRDTDKLDGFDKIATSENGLKYLTEYSNAFISAKVISATEVGTHTVFIAEVTEAQVLNDEKSATYVYYFEHIKPKPEAKSAPANEKKIVGWRCKICGYEYEGAELPEEFICPWCKHPASDFEPIYG